MKGANEGRESQVWSQVVISFYFYFILFFSVAKFCRLVDFVSFENVKNECFLGGSFISKNLNSIKSEIVRF